MKLNIQDQQDIFVYKMTADNGGAPCVQDDILSLCICMSRIRPYTRKGDWIIGLGGKDNHKLRGRIIYIAQVAQRMMGKEYYNESGKWAKASRLHLSLAPAERNLSAHRKSALSQR